MAKTIDITRASNGGVVITINGIPRTLSNPENIQIKELFGIDDANGIGAGLLGITISSLDQNFKVKVTTLDTFTINGVTAPTVIPDQIYVLNNWIFSGPAVYSGTPTKLAQTITYSPAPATRAHTAPAFNLAAVSSSGLPITYSSADATKFTCTGTNGILCTPVAAGTANIQCNQAGNTWYAAATQLNVPFTLT